MKNGAREPHISPVGTEPVSVTLAITNAKVLPHPDAPPVEHATIKVQDGQIIEFGSDVRAASDVPALNAHGGVVTAGFWNTHIHLTESKWAAAKRKPVEVLNQQLADMLTSRGFTTAVDLGSDPRITFEIRRRIASRELLGPRIYSAGPGIYPPRGVPYYLRDSLPFYVRWLFLPQPSSPSAAARVARRNFAHGADLLKLFTGSYVARGKVLPMPEPVARAAADVAHSRGRLVFAHPSNFSGTLVAYRCGVDVLAHAPDSTEGIDDSFLRSLVARRMAMVPTLKMFGTTVGARSSYLTPIYDLVRRFHGFGGQLLFGTDVGYMTDYSTEGEFDALRQSGLAAGDMLRMLTLAPAERFGVSERSGSIAPGKAADLVILDGDPREDIRAFTRVTHTIVDGRVAWARRSR